MTIIIANPVRYAPVFVEHSQIELRVRTPQRGGFAIPSHGFLLILADPDALLIHHGYIELGICMAFLSRREKLLLGEELFSFLCSCAR